MVPAALLTLPEAIRRLRQHYGPVHRPPTTDPFELILLENVAYLASGSKREEAFKALQSTVGTRPLELVSASDEALEEVASRGILKGTSAAKLRECGRIALDDFGGDLNAALKGTLASAKKALKAFPGIGDPGAEKILLLSGLHPFLAPESNGLRVLARLGFVIEDKSYAKTYAASREAAKALPAKVDPLQEAHLLLQLHGQTLCKRSRPNCKDCPLQIHCPYS